jgi:hypothetical protein
LRDRLPALSNGKRVFFCKNFSLREFFALRFRQAKQKARVIRKEVMKMKSIKLGLGAMAVTGALGLSAVSTRAETVISKDVFTDGSYCHTKFESIREDTLASGQPISKNVDDIIDFYGPCNHDPLGKDEIQSQRLEMQHRFENEYND